MCTECRLYQFVYITKVTFSQYSNFSISGYISHVINQQIGWKVVCGGFINAEPVTHLKSANRDLSLQTKDNKASPVGKSP